MNARHPIDIRTLVAPRSTQITTTSSTQSTTTATTVEVTRASNFMNMRSTDFPECIRSIEPRPFTVPVGYASKLTELFSDSLDKYVNRDRLTHPSHWSQGDPTRIDIESESSWLGGIQITKVLSHDAAVSLQGFAASLRTALPLKRGISAIRHQSCRTRIQISHQYQFQPLSQLFEQLAGLRARMNVSMSQRTKVIYSGLHDQLVQLLDECVMATHRFDRLLTPPNASCFSRVEYLKSVAKLVQLDAHRVIDSVAIEREYGEYLETGKGKFVEVEMHLAFYCDLLTTLVRRNSNQSPPGSRTRRSRARQRKRLQQVLRATDQHQHHVSRQSNESLPTTSICNDENQLSQLRQKERELTTLVEQSTQTRTNLINEYSKTVELQGNDSALSRLLNRQIALCTNQPANDFAAHSQPACDSQHTIVDSPASDSQAEVEALTQRIEQLTAELQSSEKQIQTLREIIQKLEATLEIEDRDAQEQEREIARLQRDAAVREQILLQERERAFRFEADNISLRLMFTDSESWRLHDMNEEQPMDVSNIDDPDDY